MGRGEFLEFLARGQDVTEEYCFVVSTPVSRDIIIIHVFFIRKKFIRK